jgi:predicted secreted Zn-dependent protease
MQHIRARANNQGQVQQVQEHGGAQRGAEPGAPKVLRAIHLWPRLKTTSGPRLSMSFETFISISETHETDTHGTHT